MKACLILGIMESYRFKCISIITILLANSLLFASCCYNIEGRIRVTDEAGKAISRVKILQNTTLISEPCILPLHPDEDQKRIRLYRKLSDKDGYICYSEKLYRPSMSYLLFYKEGYFPTFVRFSDIRKHESVVLVNMHSRRLRVGDMVRSYMGYRVRRNGSENVANLKRVYDQDFNKCFSEECLFQVLEELWRLKNEVGFFYW